MTTLTEMLDRLPPDRRRKVEAMSEELLAEVRDEQLCGRREAPAAAPEHAQGEGHMNTTTHKGLDMADDSGFHRLHRAVEEGVDFADPAAGPVLRFRICNQWVAAGPERDVALEVGPHGQFGIDLPACPDCGGTLNARVAGRVPGTYGCAGCGSRFVHNQAPPWADRIGREVDA